MLVNTERKSLNLNSVTINENVSCLIEQDIIVPDTKPDAVKIVTVSVTPYVTDYEILNNKIKINGKMNYFVIYKVEDEKFTSRGLYVSYPYSEVLNVNGINKDMDIQIVPVVKNIIYLLPNERKISVKSETVFKIKGNYRSAVDLLEKINSDNQIECKMCKNKFDNILCNKKSIIVGKEDVILPNDAEDLYEILNVKESIVNAEYKESYNKIMLKGDININILYLTTSSEDMTKRVNISVPFSSMVEIEGINDKTKFDVIYHIQDFDTKINTDITTTKTLTVEYKIMACIKVYEEEEIEYVEDFYSTDKDLKYDENRGKYVTSYNKFIKTIDIKENLSNILAPNSKLVDYNLDLSYINCDVTGNNIILSGNTKVLIYYINLDTNELENKAIDIAINEKVTADNIYENCKVITDIKNNGISIIQNGQDLDLKMSLKLIASVENVSDLNIVSNLEESEMSNNNLDSMNIYIVKKGDNLWSIAKKYKTSIEKILKLNEDIVDKNKINEGQKIFIIR